MHTHSCAHTHISLDSGERVTSEKNNKKSLDFRVTLYYDFLLFSISYLSSGCCLCFCYSVFLQSTFVFSKQSINLLPLTIYHLHYPNPIQHINLLLTNNTSHQQRVPQHIPTTQHIKPEPRRSPKSKAKHSLKGRFLSLCLGNGGDSRLFLVRGSYGRDAYCAGGGSASATQLLV